MVSVLWMMLLALEEVEEDVELERVELAEPLELDDELETELEETEVDKDELVEVEGLDEETKLLAVELCDVVVVVELVEASKAYPPTAAIIITTMTITTAKVRLIPTLSLFTIKFVDCSKKAPYLDRSVLNEEQTFNF